MSDLNLLSFCDTYRYPPIIREHLHRIQKEIVAQVPDIHGILLIGSTARGEFSYRIESDGNITLWSDYELLIVTKEKPNKLKRAKLFHILSEFEKEWGKDSPLFHIDYSYISFKTLQDLPSLIRHYEAKQIGKVIFGRDIRPDIPEINATNLDYKELAEVILWRLWAIVLYAPQSWLIKGRKNEKTEERKNLKTKDDLFSFVLCRNALDLTTYLLPWEKVFLPLFRERTKYIKDHYPELRLREFFDSSFPEFLNNCLQGKLAFQFLIAPEQLYQQTLAYFVQAGKHLLAVNGIKESDSELTVSLLKYQSRLFNEFRFRRKVYELFLILKFRPQKSISGWWRWYWQGKIGKMMGCLYHLHFALQAIAITGELKVAEDHLNTAILLLAQISIRHIPAGCREVSIPIGERWQLVRKAFARFLMDLYQSVGVKENYLNKILCNHEISQD